MNRDVPASRPIHELGIDAVVRDADRRDVGQEVVEQDLTGRQRQERQEQRRRRHADHVAEVGARGDQDVLERVGERLPPLLDAAADDVQARAPAARSRRPPARRRPPAATERLVSAACMAGASLIAVAQEADDVPHLLQRQDDAFLLIRIHLDEQIGPSRPRATAPRRGARRARRPVSTRSARMPTRRRDVLRDEPVVAGDDLDRHAQARRDSSAPRTTPSFGRSRKVRKPTNVRSRSSSRP